MTRTLYRKRTYACDECNQQFPAFQALDDATVPDCPFCHPSQVEVTGFPSVVKGHASKAVDYAWQMAQNDYGMTNMKDNQRAGEDAAFIPHQGPTTAEADRQMQQVSEVVQSMSAAAPGYSQAVTEQAKRNLTFKQAKPDWQSMPGSTNYQGPSQGTGMFNEIQKVAKGKRIGTPVGSYNG